MSFEHRLVVGVTGHGKSFKMKEWAAMFLAKKVRVVVYLPVREKPKDAWPKGSTVARTVDELDRVLGHLKKHRCGAVVFIDEARFLRQQVKPHHVNLINLGSAGRHDDFPMFIASQYPTSIEPNLRWNCARAFIFRLGMVEQAKDLWIQYGSPSIRWQAHEVDVETGKVCRKYMDMVPVWELITQLPQRMYFELTTTSVKFVGKPFPVLRYRRPTSRRR